MLPVPIFIYLISLKGGRIKKEAAIDPLESDRSLLVENGNGLSLKA